MFSGDTEHLEQGTVMTVTAQTDVEVDVYRWYLNGAALTGEGDRVLSIGGGLALGDYRLDCIVQKGDVISSGNIQFSVVEQAAGDQTTAGWVKPGYDIGGTSYYPFSSLANTGSLSELWKKTGVSDARVLTADLDADSAMDIVVSDGSTLRAFDGTGVELWSASTSGDLLHIGDLDANGAPEICLGSRDASDTLSIDIYDADGDYTKSLDHGTGGYDSGFGFMIQSGDYLVCRYRAGYSKFPRGIGVFSYTSGIEEAFYEVAGSTGRSSLACGDPDNDGLLEVALGWSTPHNGASANGTTDGDLYGMLLEIDLNGTPSINLQFSRKLDYWNNSTNTNGILDAMMPDLDGDGIPEIIYYESHDARYYPGTNHVYKVDADGELVAQWTGVVNGHCASGTVVNDVTMDGVKELVFSSPYNPTVSIVDGATFTTVVELADAGTVLGAADFDGDSLDEIIIYHSGTDEMLTVNSPPRMHESGHRWRSAIHQG